jgi:hypothetical protein
MAVKSKIGAFSVNEIVPIEKKTRQGQSKNSKPSHGRKKLRGQGKS